MFNFQLKVCMPWHAESFCLCKRQNRANKLFVSIYAPFPTLSYSLTDLLSLHKIKKSAETAFSLHFVTISSVFLSSTVKYC